LRVRKNSKNETRQLIKGLKTIRVICAAVVDLNLLRTAQITLEKFQKANSKRKFQSAELNRIRLFPLAEIFFCLSGQTGGGQARGQTVQLGQNFKGPPNKSYCS
jgi:hypothetical protein